MVKILIAPDSMKDCLTSEEVGKNIALGIQAIIPDAEIKVIPMADGGEGTTRALVAAMQGKLMEVEVHDPLMKKIRTFYGVLEEHKTAVIEVAAASGLELLKKDERNPWHTSSYGTGELIKAALDQGCRSFLIGLGGSATNDAGAGIIQALGGKLLDKEGKDIQKGGGALSELADIDLSGLDGRLGQCTILVACDVQIPLCGEQGTSKVYGAQKGADEFMREKLDRNLAHFAAVVRKKTGIDIAAMPGAGAAGGIAGMLKALLHAELKPGFELVSGLTGLEEEIKRSDLVITGEGRTDSQTLSGKVPLGIALLGRKLNIPVCIISGSILPGAEKLFELGIVKITALEKPGMTSDYSISNAPQLLQVAASDLMIWYKGYKFPEAL
ncbi:MAG: glycerate kinase [Cytophagaceae bacterium]